MQNLWTWGGVYFGYREGELLFNYRGRCVGRFCGDEVYGRRGEYLGEIMSDDRLITNKSKKSWRSGPAPRAHRGAVAPFVNYVGYVMYAGYEDFPAPESSHLR